MRESDEALYGKLLGGDLVAFDRLYERYARPLYGFVHAQLGNSAEAEDVCHESFLAVLRARGAETELQSFKAWLFQVARNLCLNRVRARNRASRAIEAITATASSVPEHDPVPSASLASLQRAVAQLPSTLAEVYRLRASGLSYQELATILDVPLGTVKSRIHEMIKRLREELRA
jgi:RNA polymerase sigma-70 factor (ECF subfamily)